MDKPEPTPEPKLPIKLDIDYTTVLITFIVLLITVILLWIRKSRSSKTDFLLIGLTESGKTLVFSQLLYSKTRDTFLSISENIGNYQCGRGYFRIIDLPGHERLRAKFFDQYKSSAKGIIFVVDSVKLQKDIRDVADYLYTILSDSAVTNVPLLILCNKQDDPMAKGCGVVKTLLEKELNLIRTTRASQLESVDDAKVSSVFLGKPDKDFEFSHVKQNVQVLECSALKKELNHLTDWIDRVV